jgi:ribosomal protein L18E
VESDDRFYRRRAIEELAAANRAVTEAARERRIQLAQVFLSRLDQSDAMLFEWSEAGRRAHL